MFGSVAFDNMLKKHTGDKDEEDLPLTEKIVDWRKFNTDFQNTQRQYAEVHDICEDHKDELIDLRPYMIEEPFVVSLTDKFPKVLELFRHMHVRALPVIDPNTGLPVAVLTRQDIFAYMSL